MDYRTRGGLSGRVMLVGVGILILALIVAAAVSTVRVDAGEACVMRSFGDPTGVQGSGISWVNPVGRSERCYTTRSLVYETVDHDVEGTNSKADYVDTAVDGTTVDGQSVKVTYTLRYRLAPDNLMDIHTNIGSDINAVNERVVKFHSRTVVRQVINKHTASDLYLGGLDATSEEIQGILEPLFAESGVTLEHFELKRPSFGAEYTDAVETKQLRTEEAEAARNEQEVARQEAETRKIRAQAEADARVIEAEGNAKALEVEGQAYRDFPELVQVKTIEALESADLVVVPDGSFPILDLGKTEQQPTPEPVETGD